DQPMFILNGEEIPREDFNLIQPDDIESITVLKDHAAFDKYGEGAKNGVIIIKTKNSIKLRTNKILSFDKDNPPLIYKDGVEISLEDAEKINPKTVESISVTKGDSVKEKYGEKGKNGVVIIKMKE
ncbi:MAG: TonB-dependent receptor plug domain-containing protein, partial [Cyclobacteriaceae bacterium]|nr:TonB-dependent receptor plug domain-containing protein [Cyclobacteriaceae bacterium]